MAFICLAEMGHKVQSSKRIMRKVFISDIRWSYLFNYFGKGDSLFRYYQDLVLESVSSEFEGDIIELGGERKYNTQRFFKGNTVLVSNISRDYDQYIDVTDMNLDADSVHNYLMISMLQHVDQPFKAIDEVKRTLKPGGKILLINAFMHPICDERDYWRFGEDAYHQLFKEGFVVEKVYYLGGKFSTMSNTFRRPIGTLKLRYLLFKFIGFGASLFGKFFDRIDGSPIGVGVLVYKLK